MGVASLALLVIPINLFLPYTVSSEQMESQKYVAYFKHIKIILFSFFTNKRCTCIIHCTVVLKQICIRYIIDYVSGTKEESADMPARVIIPRVPISYHLQEIIFLIVCRRYNA